MKIEQIYTGCLAEAAYYIESNGEAVIIDPLREIQPYLDRAEADNAKIKYIFETHFHADFVSGHIDLAKKSEATIVYGPTAQPAYEAYIAKDGEFLKVGNISFKILHTPGHTMESTTYLLIDEHGKEHAIFTGDTLFIGDVGRPDLAVKTDLTQEDLAGHLYTSLREKIMPLADDIIVYPAHGAGSACGKHMSQETSATLGDQKKFNYALAENMTRDAFIKAVTEGLVAPPQYFPKNATLNKTGYNSFESVLEKGLVPLSPDQFENIVNEHGALVLDTRSPELFAESHIPNAIFIGIDGSFATWVGTLITDLEQPILIISEAGREEEVITRLSRVGYDNTLGYLQGGMNTWQKSGKDVSQINRINPSKLEELYTENKDIHVLDVRKAAEYNSQHLEGVPNFPLDFINKNMAQLNKNEKYYLHCAGGYRSMIAASILQARGYNEITDVREGFGGLSKTSLPLTTLKAQTVDL